MMVARRQFLNYGAYKISMPEFKLLALMFGGFCVIWQLFAFSVHIRCQTICVLVRASSVSRFAGN